jgi:8-oxo-dGTP pyrophosphatase MutT (NUDIX family)
MNQTFNSAQREAQEELGIKAEEWIELGVFDLDTNNFQDGCWVILLMSQPSVNDSLKKG